MPSVAVSNGVTKARNRFPSWGGKGYDGFTLVLVK